MALPVIGDIPSHPVLPTEPNSEPEVPSATAETTVPTEPNFEPEVPFATAEMTAPIEPNASRRANPRVPKEAGHAE